jgi:Mrp family chromosome partitioning ATPase
MTNRRPGQIITFYSYKGGTGRTMALANVACLLARPDPAHRQATPPRVLAIDWDFEAPGLHRFLQPYLDRILRNASPRLQVAWSFFSTLAASARPTTPRTSSATGIGQGLRLRY